MGDQCRLRVGTGATSTVSFHDRLVKLSYRSPA